MPDPAPGLEYKNMGTMENHIWSIIAKRMKHNHTSWSIKGGNNLAKILAKKCCGKLNEVFEKQILNPIHRAEECEFDVNTTPRDIKYKVGAGYDYPMKGIIPGLSLPTKGDGVRLKKLAGI